jgi:hypothetical protein
MRSETATTLTKIYRKEQKLSKKRARPAKPTEQEKIKIFVCSKDADVKLKNKNETDNY